MTDNRDVDERPDDDQSRSADASANDGEEGVVDGLFLDPDDSESEEVEFDAAPAEVGSGDAEPAPAEAAREQPSAVADAAATARIGELEAERDELKNRLLRTAADLENFRKRTMREKDELRRYGIDRVVLELLPVIDNLERALEHADKNADASSVVDGVKMVHRQFVSALEKHGVQGFESVGTMFDPQKHEAIQQVETADADTGTVLEQYQKGYYLHDRLIRPAMVVVARRAAGEEPAPLEPAGDEAEEDGEEPAGEAANGASPWGGDDAGTVDDASDE